MSELARTTCSIDGCENALRTKNSVYCNKHYLRMRRHGDATFEYERQSCLVDGCGYLSRTIWKRSYCEMHTKRLASTGRLDRPERLPSVKEQIPEAVKQATPEKCWALVRDARKSGYGTLYLLGKTLYAHRVVCELVHGKPPTALHHAAHRCGNRSCINHHHLRWATAAENIADKAVHGTNVGRNGSPMNILTDAQVVSIKTMLQAGARPTELARQFCVSPITIRRILKGHTHSKSKQKIGASQ